MPVPFASVSETVANTLRKNSCVGNRNFAGLVSESADLLSCRENCSCRAKVELAHLLDVFPAESSLVAVHPIAIA